MNAQKRFRQIPPQRAWMEIDLETLEHNVRTLQNLLPASCKLLPAVKANAYGFGAVPITKALHRLGVTDFCVASLSEGIELRKQGIRGNILILGYTHPDNCRLLKRYRLTQTVVDYTHAEQLAKKGIQLPVHIKIDTGMRRLGERSDNADKLRKLFSLKELIISGVFTQLSCSDSTNPDDIEYTNMQISNFYAALQELKEQMIVLPKAHIQCSYGIINYPSISADYARPGLALYGIVDESCCIGRAPCLRPIFTIKTRIALIKQVYAGERIGYGNTVIAHENMKVAVITMGYADGLPRSLSKGMGKVLVNGQYASIIGNICMDQAIVDVSHLDDVAPGDVAVVIGHSGSANISINEFARWAGTIPNEIASRFGERLERKYCRGNMT